MRRCTTVPGLGTCCRAAQAGQLNQPIRITTGHGEKCGICTPTTNARTGRHGFKFRFRKSGDCGLMAGGCPMPGAVGQTLALPGRF